MHADDTVDKEDEANEDGYPGQRLEGFDESPEECSDALAFAEKLHQPHDTEQTEEVDGNHVASGLKFKKQTMGIEIIFSVTYTYFGV